MNACLEAMPDEPAALDVRAACDVILASPAFANAPRMCQLLAFLIEKKLTGGDNEVSEYAIGLEVFGRDARCYDTLSDPLVRVQMGRLRERLSLYYAGLATPPALRIAIPLGRYLPVIHRQPQTTPAPAPAPAPERGTLELSPLEALAHDGTHAAFVRGLDEEIRSHLFARFGAAIRLREAGPVRPGTGLSCQRLEGSIRVENEHVRASVRLVEAGGGDIRWVSQYDCRGQLGMALQEQLAGAICAGIQDHLGAAAP